MSDRKPVDYRVITILQTATLDNQHISVEPACRPRRSATPTPLKRTQRCHTIVRCDSCRIMTVYSPIVPLLRIESRSAHPP